MRKRFDLIVFDWDGTLMDSTAAIAGSIQLACSDLGLPVPDDERARHVIGLGMDAALAYAVPMLKPEQMPEMLARCRVHFLARARLPTLFPGVRDMLSALYQAGWLLAVATGKSRAGLDRSLMETELASLFVATRCADETRAKPDPAMLFDLVDSLNVDVRRTVMIGDTTHDLQMATDAGAAAVAVSYGAHPAAGLRRLNPLACLHSVSELHDWLVCHA